MVQRLADQQMEYGSGLWLFERGVSDRSGFYLERTDVDPAGRGGKNTFKRVHRADWKCDSRSCCAYVFADRDRNRSLRHDSAFYTASGDCPGDRDFCVFEIYSCFYCD